MYVLVGIVCCAAFIMDFILLPIYFSKTTYTFDGRFINKKGGLFIVHKQFMKADSMQYATVIKTPFSKITGLNFVIIHALGGVMILHFISSNDLREIEKIVSRVLKSES